METTVNKRSKFIQNGKISDWIIQFTTYAFILLYIYTASDKLWTIKDFVVFISRLDLFQPIGTIVAWAIPISEILISLLLLIPITRFLGLVASTGLIVIFTLYLLYMKITLSALPCACGGVISKLGWTNHIFFNLIFVLLGVLAIFFFRRRNVVKDNGS